MKKANETINRPVNQNLRQQNSKCEKYKKVPKMMIFETLTSWTSRLIRIQKTSHRDSHQIPDMYYVQAASLFSVICEQCQKDTKGQIMGHPSTLKDF